MSDEIPTFTLKAARKYNGKFADKTTWPGIPEAALRAFPGLTQSTDSREYAEAVFGIQRVFGCLEDGCLGPATYLEILRQYDPVPNDDPYIVFGKRRIVLDNVDYRVINFDQPGGYDLHPAGHFSARIEDVRGIVMHWGGFNPESLYNVMNGPRKVSTHFGIGLDDEGQATVYQYLDVAHKAWHAGSANEGTVGIDICQQPVYKHIGYYQKRGYFVSRGHNPTSRGNKNIMSLDPRIADVTNKFVHDLSVALDIVLTAPSSHDVVSELTDYSLLGHHHISPNKWDIACWWADIFAGTGVNI
jgi:hypothetical protein